MEPHPGGVLVQTQNTQEFALMNEWHVTAVANLTAFCQSRVPSPTAAVVRLFLNSTQLTGRDSLQVPGKERRCVSCLRQMLSLHLT